MKKYLIVLAAAVVALASCKPGGESGSKYTKISFKESAIELAIGETAKLKVLTAVRKLAFVSRLYELLPQ